MPLAVILKCGHFHKLLETVAAEIPSRSASSFTVTKRSSKGPVFAASVIRPMLSLVA